MNSQDIRSVYQMNEIEDEWATIVKFDTELFKKEKELEKLRQIEQKKKIRNEYNK